MLILFLKHGLDINARGWCEKSLLKQFVEYFVEKDDSDVQDIAEILINSGMSYQYNDILGYSVFTRNIELVSFFIKKGANVNEPAGFFKILPLQLAARCDVDVINLLLLKGADVNGKDNFGTTALLAACATLQPGCQNIVSLLIHKGANISPEDRNDWTPFRYLLESLEDDYEVHTSKQCMRILIKEFAKLKFKNQPILQKDLNLIQAHSKSHQCFESCIEELDRMSKTKFYAFYTYEYILNTGKNVRKLAFLTKNEEFVAAFEKNLSFSFYDSDLRRIFDNATQARDKSAAVIYRLHLIFGNFLPDIVISKMEKNLTLDDISF